MVVVMLLEIMSSSVMFEKMLSVNVCDLVVTQVGEVM